MGISKMACCLTTVTLTLIFLIILKLSIKLWTGWDRSPTCLVGKTTIVTGANTGIGFYTAQDLAKRGARVILACRNNSKAEEARFKIIEATGNSNVVVRTLDLASLASVRKFAEEITKTEERLDILVNNAGAAGFGDITTDDGLNLLMQVNYFGPFLLTLLLVDLLKKSTPSRIVNVSSALSQIAKLNINNLNHFSSNMIDYANSKLCNIIFTNELARKLKGSGVTANSVHPGVVQTEIFRRTYFVIQKSIQWLSNTAEEGAQTSIYVAVSKNLEGVSGEYFDNCKIGWLPPMPKIARDEGLAKKVWQKSEKFVKLAPEEFQF